MQTFEQQEIDLGGGEHVVARFFSPSGPARGALPGTTGGLPRCG